MPTTVNSPAPAHLLDVTRTVSRAHLHPTGIDRIERAYLAHLAQCPTPLLGLLRTPLGYLLLDRQGCADLHAHCARRRWTCGDAISRVMRRTNPGRGATEAGLRRIAVDRATPPGLGGMLRRHLPEGTVYFNIGQTNFTDRVIGAAQSARLRIVPYLHDTIPLDLPETQTPKSRRKFENLLDRADKNADLVLCNSQATKRSLLRHTGLAPSRIEVLLPGLPDMTIGTAPGGPWSDRPYFVTIGTIEPRKNIGFLLDLWRDFDGTDAPQLLICGKRGWLSEEVFARLDSAANVHELPSLPDPQLWALLEQANGLLFPSRAEGFGYPAIEAAHLNVPLICNPLPAFEEVLGQYPIYAAESDSYAWRNKIEQLAQARRGQSGEQNEKRRFRAPEWQAHFNRLFTLL
ncbi:glycosyltransferase family 1 protein [Marivita sp. GX14005]|uniref:glycosyltransferase family 4 protein n=1 Tax=Marivita sp. GX14005 TaxID=2942276 RepID=UPI00201931FB|nr:glycosyltransferase family 1 protein [Marivita sp. GX14005]MCL3881435.1 glycosyltransferase family 4 protein [Marivita sp. GX14005]